MCVLPIFLTEAKIPDAVLHVLSLGGVGVCPSNFPLSGGSMLRHDQQLDSRSLHHKVSRVSLVLSIGQPLAV